MALPPSQSAARMKQMRLIAPNIAQKNITAIGMLPSIVIEVTAFIIPISET